jgi:hypothetical protein
MRQTLRAGMRCTMFREGAKIGYRRPSGGRVRIPGWDTVQPATPSLPAARPGSIGILPEQVVLVQVHQLVGQLPFELDALVDTVWNGNQNNAQVCAGMSCNPGLVAELERLLQVAG